eukprot:Protomagalhaensia_sp_Gyna_25__5579@NODE_766_length_2661_cov_5_668955_g601_i0_p1_GENE_NODE_766_length_2661_cov_5_668955_g601_i0NODE_766_length_2661_cov_5_668955_g601_i0_p1_ORF_typecomplete_len392_score66_54_NODE_766_length_2661_cov_5_668955_g601_i07481923
MNRNFGSTAGEPLKSQSSFSGARDSQTGTPTIRLQPVTMRQQLLESPETAPRLGGGGGAGRVSVYTSADSAVASEGLGLQSEPLIREAHISPRQLAIEITQQQQHHLGSVEEDPLSSSSSSTLTEDDNDDDEWQRSDELRQLGLQLTKVSSSSQTTSFSPSSQDAVVVKQPFQRLVSSVSDFRTPEPSSQMIRLHAQPPQASSTDRESPPRQDQTGIQPSSSFSGGTPPLPGVPESSSSSSSSSYSSSGRALITASTSSSFLTSSSAFPSNPRLLDSNIFNCQVSYLDLVHPTTFKPTPSGDQSRLSRWNHQVQSGYHAQRPGNILLSVPIRDNSSSSANRRHQQQNQVGPIPAVPAAELSYAARPFVLPQRPTLEPPFLLSANQQQQTPA